MASRVTRLRLTRPEGAEVTVAIGDPCGDCAAQAGTQTEVATSISGAFAPAGFFVISN